MRKRMADLTEADRDRERTRQREKERRWRAANPEKSRARTKRWKEAHPGEARAASQRANMLPHGRDAEIVIAVMRAEQNGRCYLCEQPFPEDGRDRAGFVDHDHTCPHPRRGAKGATRGSCAACRRGLICHNCNVLIGHADDDPALLRLIAGNLEAVLGPTRARIAAKPRQLSLDDAAG